MAKTLQKRIADQIEGLIGQGELPASFQLRTQSLSDRLGVSRTPVRAALEILSERGLVEKREGRGYRVRQDVETASLIDLSDLKESVPEQYFALAEDWLADRIDDEVTESYLRERYGLTKIGLLEIMRAGEAEGWVQRKKGYGWRFLPVAKTPEALDQIYQVRAAIEPAAILAPGFKADIPKLREIVRFHEVMLSGMIDSLPKDRFVSASAQFHEIIIAMSHNPFFMQTLQRLNGVRRLLQYRSVRKRESFYVTYQEHLDIVEAILAERREYAAELMKRHLVAPSFRRFSSAADAAATTSATSGAGARTQLLKAGSTGPDTP